MRGPAAVREADFRPGRCRILLREAEEANEEFHAQFVISARKTARLVEQLCEAEWRPSPKTDAGWECEFRYRPEGSKKAYPFVALRYEKACEEGEPEQTEQYQLFETSQYQYRVFVTNLRDPSPSWSGFTTSGAARRT